MRPLFGILILLLATGPVFGQRAVLLKGSAKFFWPRSAGEISPANKIGVQDIELFVNSLLENVAGPHVKIQEFRFAPLEKTKIHLVATGDFSGRSLYFMILLLSPENGTFRYFEIPSADPHFLPRELIGIDGDGIYELLAKDLVGGYEGAETHPIYWYSILRVSDGNLVDVSREFPDFYRITVLPEVGFMTNWIFPLQKEGELYTEFLAEYRFVYLKTQRKVFGDGKAGLKEAMSWGESGNHRLQLLAINTLKEIDDPMSVSQLRKMAGLTDLRSADCAKNALAEMTENK